MCLRKLRLFQGFVLFYDRVMLFHILERYQRRGMFKPILPGRLIFLKNNLFCFDLSCLFVFMEVSSCVLWSSMSLTLFSHYFFPLKIVHISKVYKDRWYIFVWDGTEMPPCNILVK